MNNEVDKSGQMLYRLSKHMFCVKLPPPKIPPFMGYLGNCGIAGQATADSVVLGTVV